MPAMAAEQPPRVRLSRAPCRRENGSRANTERNSRGFPCAPPVLSHNRPQNDDETRRDDERRKREEQKARRGVCKRRVGKRSDAREGEEDRVRVRNREEKQLNGHQIGCHLDLFLYFSSALPLPFFPLFFHLFKHLSRCFSSVSSRFPVMVAPASSVRYWKRAKGSREEDKNRLRFLRTAKQCPQCVHLSVHVVHLSRLVLRGPFNGQTMAVSAAFHTTGCIGLCHGLCGREFYCLPRCAVGDGEGVSSGVSPARLNERDGARSRKSCRAHAQSLFTEQGTREHAGHAVKSVDQLGDEGGTMESRAHNHCCRVRVNPELQSPSAPAAVRAFFRVFSLIFRTRPSCTQCV